MGLWEVSGAFAFGWGSKEQNAVRLCGGLSGLSADGASRVELVTAKVSSWCT